MAQRKFRASVSNSENVVSFHRSAVTDRGATALELVYQAADVFRDMEEHARETEARAQSLCDSALQGIRRAEARAEEADRRNETSSRMPKKSWNALPELWRKSSRAWKPPKIG